MLENHTMCQFNRPFSFEGLSRAVQARNFDKENVPVLTVLLKFAEKHAEVYSECIKVYSI